MNRRTLKKICGTTGCLSAAMLFLAAGQPAIAAGPTTYQTLHWTGADELATTVERTPDGGTISAGTARNFISASDIMMVKMDACGNRQWSRYYTNPFANGQLQAHSVRVARDGNYVVAGEIRPSPIPGHEIFMMKVNAVTGAVIWAHAYRGQGWTTFGGTVVRELSGPGGGFVLVGRGRDVQNATLMGGILITTNALGNQTGGCVWNDPRFGQLNMLSFNDVRQNPDSSFTITGWTRRSDIGPAELLVTRTLTPTACGGMRWSRTYFGQQGTPDAYFGESLDLAPATGIQGTPNFIAAGYAVTGPWRDGFSGAEIGSAILRIDQNGNPIWLRRTNDLLEAQSIRTTAARDYVIAGKSISPVGLGDGAIMRVDPAGTPIWEQLLDNAAFPGRTEFAQEAIPMPDGGFAIAAEANNYFSAVDYWLSKTNSVGSSPAGCDLRIPPQAHVWDIVQQLDLSRRDIPPNAQLQILFTQPQIEFNDVCNHVCACISPPRGMTLWLPFDEPAGLTAFNIMNTAVNGVDVNGPSHNLGSFVDNSRCFDGVNDYVNVLPSYAGLKPATGSFTIDAWVRKSSVDSTIQIIVDHRQETSGPVRGYSWFLGGANTQALQLGDASGFTNWPAPAVSAVPGDNQWHHVAVVVNRNPFGPTGAAQFYLDGSPAGPAVNVAARSGNINPPATIPFRVGARSDNLGGNFRGCIDEVEFHRRALSAAEVRTIFLAGPNGKCKNRVAAPVSWFCLPTQSTVNATMTITNYGPTPATYNWTLNGVGVGPGCSVSGPTGFSPSSGTTAPINPGQTLFIPVTIARPSGLVAAGLTGCYDFTATNNLTAEVTTAQGKVVDARGWCIATPNPTGAIAVLAQRTTALAIDVTNDDTSPSVGTLRLRAIGPDMEPDLEIISLNGLPPGQPVLRTVSLNPGDSTTLLDTIEFVEPDYQPFYTILIEADLDGDGEWEPLAAQRVLNIDRCVADVDDGSGTGTPDGGVGIEDLLFYLNLYDAGDVAADVDDGSGTGIPDGGVGIEDLLYYLQRYDGGC